MPLKNYTTEVPAGRSLSQIQANLVAHGARAVMINYTAEREPESLSFIIATPQGEMPFRLPANIPAVAKLLAKMGDPDYRKWDSRYQQQKAERLRKQAPMVAWRIIKDWTDAQLAIIETEMVTMEQVFLPYMQVNGGQTLYELMVSKRFLMPEGK
ncbi:MAG: hypothetical protein WC455_15870 [Dehalococcoidia bacterium]|jgi:hypothetical protein